jgi:hypothetical protein
MLGMAQLAPMVRCFIGLIVVVLDGALPSTAIGTISYAEAAGQKVNCRPLA